MRSDSQLVTGQFIGVFDKKSLIDEVLGECKNPNKHACLKFFELNSIQPEQNNKADILLKLAITKDFHKTNPLFMQLWRSTAWKLNEETMMILEVENSSSQMILIVNYLKEESIIEEDFERIFFERKET